MSDLSDSILRFLRGASAATSAELQQACNASQASVSRALAPLLAAGEVLKMGRARSQQYVMPRLVPSVSTTATIPIVKVDDAGRVSEFGTLVPAVGGRCWVEEFEEPLTQLHGGLPWFLADMRPQGFLGRAFAHARRDLGLADNPNHWNDDDVLKALCLAGDDLPGNLIVGERALELHQRAAAPQRVPASDYAKLADAAMHGAPPLSSAGGEQPKFCATREDGHPVIVKFSPAGDSPAELRWKDLLVCEHLSLQVLAEAGVPASRSRIFDGAGRMLLEVERFDRTPRGRIGMVSLLSFDNEYVGQIDNWAAAAERMVTRGLLRQADTDRLRLLEAYNVQIGNNDRHYGNISLLIDARGSWTLAPAYDTLPMVYAPVAGEIVPRDDFDPSRLVPTAHTLRAWPEGRALAIAFWRRVAEDARISTAFRAMSRRHAQRLADGSASLAPPSSEPPLARESAS